MKKGIKILWVIIGCVFALGVILATVGFVLGATGIAYFDGREFRFGAGEQRTVELKDNDTEAFESIDIKLIEADVEIIAANAYGYEFVYTGSNKPDITIKNNTLFVVEQSNNWSIIFGFGGWKSLFETTAKLRVFVPEDAELTTVGLSTVSGTTTLSGYQINIKKLDCKSVSGDVNITNVDLEQLALDVASGDVDLRNVSANRATINILSGWLNYEDAKLKKLDLNMTSGDVRLKGQISELLQLRMISGNADIALTGNKDDYSFGFTQLSGSILIDGQDVGNNTGWPFTSSSGANTGRGGHIEIEATSGTVMLNFTNRAA
ncbi:MAG: DUF4097 domain-containing protein [Coriobacteriia bacterium]|nr:DUF4097 domain-containing protein [Coriobacteriia bacterium]